MTDGSWGYKQTESSRTRWFLIAMALSVPLLIGTGIWVRYTLDSCVAVGHLHPLAASAVESWKRGNLTDRELTRYLTLPQSRNFPLVACLLEGRE